MRKISPPTGIRSSDRPARSQSLYRLSYPAHYMCVCVCVCVYELNPYTYKPERRIEGIQAYLHSFLLQYLNVSCQPHTSAALPRYSTSQCRLSGSRARLRILEKEISLVSTGNGTQGHPSHSVVTVLTVVLHMCLCVCVCAHVCGV